MNEYMILALEYFGIGLIWASFINWVDPGRKPLFVIIPFILWPVGIFNLIKDVAKLTLDFLLGKFSE